LQTNKKGKKIHNFYTASDVINDNSSSQPTVVSESGLDAWSANWS